MARPGVTQSQQTPDLTNTVGLQTSSPQKYTSATPPDGIASWMVPYIKNIQNPADRYTSDLYKAAESYKANSPQMEETLYNQYRTGAMSGLGDSLGKIKEGYNRRGLLNSGTRMGSELGAKAVTQTDLANQRAAINKKLSDNYQSILSAAAQSGINNANNAVDMSPYALNALQGGIDTEIAKTQAKQQAFNSLTGSLGQLGGFAAGGGFNQAKAPTQKQSVLSNTTAPASN